MHRYCLHCLSARHWQDHMVAAYATALARRLLFAPDEEAAEIVALLSSLEPLEDVREWSAAGEQLWQAYNRLCVWREESR